MSRGQLGWSSLWKKKLLGPPVVREDHAVFLHRAQELLRDRSEAADVVARLEANAKPIGGELVPAQCRTARWVAGATQSAACTAP